MIRMSPLEFAEARSPVQVAEALPLLKTIEFASVEVSGAVAVSKRIPLQALLCVFRRSKVRAKASPLPEITTPFPNPEMSTLTSETPWAEFVELPICTPTLVSLAPPFPESVQFSIPPGDQVVSVFEPKVNSLAVADMSLIVTPGAQTIRVRRFKMNPDETL